ncbi:pyrroline-5-carboxylate reductase [Alsobacter sp. KACC 23698]|uniref:Pyrroline-5-carboxylate reductase n=1 Tax=Alsobacter sp. KACC 23698 TaxID=3149229 RepID=A0AAU7JBJ1_9HYPH
MSTSQDLARKDPSRLPSSLVLVGCGKMGGALLEGWIRTGLPGERITVLDPHVHMGLVSFCERHDVTLNPPLSQVSEPEALVLGIKPQMLDDAASDLKDLAGPDTLVISILAGKTLGDLRSRLPRARAVIRAMPNLPASVQRGVTGCSGTPEVSDRQRDIANALLSGVGLVEWVESEELIDAVTAVSGSGPAYVFHLVECLARAGAAQGLPPDLAERLARATVEGAGELLHRSDLTPGTLRENVTSPGGTTAAALAVLAAPDGLAPLMDRAVAAARKRAEELSG